MARMMHVVHRNGPRRRGTARAEDHARAPLMAPPVPRNEDHPVNCVLSQNGSGNPSRDIQDPWGASAVKTSMGLPLLRSFMEALSFTLSHGEGDL